MSALVAAPPPERDPSLAVFLLAIGSVLIGAIFALPYLIPN